MKKPKKHKLGDYNKRRQLRRAARESKRKLARKLNRFKSYLENHGNPAGIAAWVFEEKRRKILMGS